MLQGTIEAVSATTDAVRAAGLVDLDASLLVQLGIFAVFAVALNLLVVKPMARTHAARFARMAGSRQDAERMDLRAAEAHGEYSKKIAHSRQEAMALRDELRVDGEKAAAASVNGVRDEAVRTLTAGRQDLDKAAVRARADSEAVVRALADTIATHVLAGPKGAA